MLIHFTSVWWKKEMKQNRLFHLFQLLFYLLAVNRPYSKRHFYRFFFFRSFRKVRLSTCGFGCLFVHFYLPCIDSNARQLNYLPVFNALRCNETIVVVCLVVKIFLHWISYQCSPAQAKKNISCPSIGLYLSDNLFFYYRHCKDNKQE